MNVAPSSPRPQDRPEPPPEPPKPRFRGRLHQMAFFLSIPAGVALVLASRGTSAGVAAVVYALSVAGMFGVSAVYHRRPWRPRGRAWMKRLDHSMIFVLIAGTYTPFALLVLHGTWQVVILAVVWAGAATGIALKMIRVDGLAALGGALYITLGWLVIVAAPQVIQGMSDTGLGLVAIGGVLYTTGALVLARHRPDPRPEVFGYHEIWHSFVVGGCACHYAAILLIVLAAR